MHNLSDLSQMALRGNLISSSWCNLSSACQPASRSRFRARVASPVTLIESSASVDDDEDIAPLPEPIECGSESESANPANVGAYLFTGRAPTQRRRTCTHFLTIRRQRLSEHAVATHSSPECCMVGCCEHPFCSPSAPASRASASPAFASAALAQAVGVCWRCLLAIILRVLRPCSPCCLLCLLHHPRLGPRRLALAGVTSNALADIFLEWAGPRHAFSYVEACQPGTNDFLDEFCPELRDIADDGRLVVHSRTRDPDDIAALNDGCALPCANVAAHAPCCSDDASVCTPQCTCNEHARFRAIAPSTELGWWQHNAPRRRHANARAGSRSTSSCWESRMTLCLRRRTSAA